MLADYFLCAGLHVDRSAVVAIAPAERQNRLAAPSTLQLTTCASSEQHTAAITALQKDLRQAARHRRDAPRPSAARHGMCETDSKRNKKLE